MSRGISIGDYTLRIYQLMFLISFILGYQIFKAMLKREKAPVSWMDPLLTYSVVATVIGARLGHVLFYQPDYYLKHPLEILMVWKGGLASHGAAIALIIAMYLLAKKVTKTPMLWLLDRLVIVVALAAAFIRIGNYTNSEIVGRPGNSSFETVFTYPAKEYLNSFYNNYIYDVAFMETEERLELDGMDYPVYEANFFVEDNVDPQDLALSLERNILPRMSLLSSDEQHILAYPDAKAEIISPVEIRIKVLGVPRYPTQLFEAGAYFISFLILIFFYLKTRKRFDLGFLFGLFLTLIFGFRLYVEQFKANQVGFEEGMSLNMGQLLSIPLILAGIYFMIVSKKKTYIFSEQHPDKVDE